LILSCENLRVKISVIGDHPNFSLSVNVSSQSTIEVQEKDYNLFLLY